MRGLEQLLHASEHGSRDPDPSGLAVVEEDGRPFHLWVARDRDACDVQAIAQGEERK